MDDIKKHLKIFIASPSDVKLEREVVRKVVGLLNQTNSKNWGIYLDVIGWEDDVYPSLGDDAQSVIFDQIGDDYTIFIGIMWGRFGIPTKNDKSGTKEEFEKAYKLYKDGKKIFVLFYFKDSPISPSKIDTEQLLQVLEFKNEISTRGALYKHFDSIEEFERMLQINLCKVVDDYISSINTKSSNEIIAVENELEEPGMYELLDLSNSEFAEFTDIILKIADYTEDLTNRMNESSAQMAKIATRPPELREKEARKAIDVFSLHLQNFSKRLDVEIPIINELFNSGINHIANAVVIYKSFNHNTEDIADLLKTINSLDAKITSTSNEINGLIEVIKTFPSLTTQLNTAKKNTIKTLTGLHTEFTSEKNLLQQLIISIE